MVIAKKAPLLSVRIEAVKNQPYIDKLPAYVKVS
jgi:hypothetical protein